MTIDPEIRFWNKVEKTETCWIWKASDQGNGYGQFWTGKRVMVAHKFLYELMKGPVPIGLVLDHLCRNRRCVNPDHLEIVTFKENLLRGKFADGRFRRSNFCKNGHEYTVENTWRYPLGKKCRICNKEQATKFRSRQPKKIDKRTILKTHCKNGHEYTLSNTRINHRPDRNISRACRTCDRELTREKRNLTKDKFREYRIISHDGGPEPL